MQVLKLLSALFDHQATPTPDSECDLVSSLASAIPTLLGGPEAALFFPLVNAFALHHAAPPAPGSSVVPAVAWQLLPQLLAHVQAPGAVPRP